MSALPHDETHLFPRLCGADGQLSGDGGALLVEATASGGDVVRFSIDLADVQHLVSYLLVWASRLGGRAGAGTNAGEEAQIFSHPIPASSVAMGKSDGEEGYLAISVGPAELLFSMPISAFDRIGRNLLTASARPTGTGSS